MSDFTKNTRNELARLSHIAASHLKQMDTILRKVNHTSHATHAKAPKLIKAPALLSTRTLVSDRKLLSGLLGSFTGSSHSSSANVSKTSNGQMMADLASVISKALKRDL